MISHASRTTHVASGQTDSVIDSGRTVKVLGFIVENSGGATGQVLFEAFGTTTVLMKASVNGGDTVQVSIPWVADAGLQVTTPSGVTCTVFHTQAL